MVFAVVRVAVVGGGGVAVAGVVVAVVHRVVTDKFIDKLPIKKISNDWRETFRLIYHELEVR